MIQADKICRHCKDLKPAAEFYVISQRWLSAACRECTKAAVRSNRRERITYYREYDKARGMHPDRVATRERYRKTDAGKAAVKKAQAAYKARAPERRKAVDKLNNAVRDGTITKPSTCSSCDKACRIHGHHDDYTKPLEVVWLCARCHRNVHIGLVV